VEVLEKERLNDTYLEGEKLTLERLELLLTHKEHLTVEQVTYLEKELKEHTEYARKREEILRGDER